MTVYGYSKPSEVSGTYHTGFLEPQVRVKKVRRSKIFRKEHAHLENGLDLDFSDD